MSPSSRSPRRRTWPGDSRSAAQIDEFHRALAVRYPDLDERERQWEKTLDARIHPGAGGRRAGGVRPAAGEAVASPAPRSGRADDGSTSRPSGRRTTALKKLRAAEPKFVTTMVVRERSGEPATDAHSPGRRLHPQGRARRAGRSRRLAAAWRMRARARRPIAWTWPAGWSIAATR